MPSRKDVVIGTMKSKARVTPGEASSLAILLLMDGELYAGARALLRRLGVSSIFSPNVLPSGI
jgi:hypothetical protein